MPTSAPDKPKEEHVSVKMMTEEDQKAGTVLADQLMTGTFIQQVNARSGQTVELCYHCHKCTAGCPFASAMTYGPDRLLRMIALDQQDEIFHSHDIWLCSGCYTCVTRCPNDIDIGAVMDALRQLSIAQGVSPAEPDALLFHRLFIGVVERLGRSYEAAMLGLFKIRSHVPLLNDMGDGIGLLLRGKVPLLPEGWRVGKAIQPIFRKSAGGGRRQE